MPDFVILQLRCNIDNCKSNECTCFPLLFFSHSSDELVTSIVAYLKSIEFNAINNVMSDSAHLMPVVAIIGFVLIVVLLKCCLRSRKTKATEASDDKSKKSK